MIRKPHNAARGRKSVLCLVLSLLLCCLTVLPALAESVEPTAIDFGDFTLTLDPNTPIQMAESRESGEVWFTLYPNYDENASAHSNINCVWLNTYDDYSVYSEDELKKAAESYIAQIRAGLEDQKIIVNDVQLLSAGLTTIGGYPSFSYSYSMDVDYSEYGVDMQLVLSSEQSSFTDASYGTYSFTITTFNQEDYNFIRSILDTISFK